jgi:large subunit ribosomal protein L4
VLIVLSGPDEASAFKSFRNIAGVNVLAADDCGVADVVGAATLVFSSDALDAVTARAKKNTQRPSAAGTGEVAA